MSVCVIGLANKNRKYDNARIARQMQLKLVLELITTTINLQMRTPLSSLVDKKRILGSRLRFYRNQAETSIFDLASETGIHSTRLSRIERGLMLPRDDEMKVVSDALNFNDEVREELWRFFRDCHATPQWIAGGYEGRPSMSDVQKIFWDFVDTHNEFRWLEVTVVPGLLQIRPYAHAIFASNIPAGDRLHTELSIDEDVEESVNVRLEHQAILFDKERTFDFILHESVLNMTYGSSEIMAMQCNHLLQLTFLSNVSIGIIRHKTPIPLGGIFPFIILDDDFVVAAHTLGHVEVTSESEIAAICKQWSAIKGIAETGESARDAIRNALVFHSNNNRIATSGAVRG